MEADDFRKILLFVKMTFDRVQDIELRFLFSVALGENGMADRLGIKAAFRILFDQKKSLPWQIPSIATLNILAFIREGKTTVPLIQFLMKAQRA